MSVQNVTTGTSYGSLSAAIAASNANDVIQISAGSDVEDFPNIVHNLTITSPYGLAYLSTITPTPVNGRAVLNVPGDGNVNLTVSGLALSGAVDANNNGAGLLFETGNGALNVTNCWFTNNQDGLLVGGVDAADPGGMTVTVTNSEFSNNGVAPSNPRFGFDHNLYTNNLTQLTVRNSYFHDALGGHEIKTRATTAVITNNRIEDGPTAQGSYSIDLSDGGADTVSGNVIEKGRSTLNKNVIAFAAEGTYPGSSLSLTGNTFIDDRGGAVPLLNQSQDSSGHTIPATVANNVFYNFYPGYIGSDVYGPPNDTNTNNTFSPAAAPALDTSHPFQFTAAPCFAAGSGVDTARGRVAVEALVIGDHVRLAAGGWSTVRWLGRRKVACRRHPRPHDVNPIRIRADAFGPGQPRRDLRLSPDHAVFADGVLIPIRYLTNGASILQEDVARIDYHHVELAAHAVIMVEGLACESYLDTGNRGAFANGASAIGASRDPVQLHPDFALDSWDRAACAPLVTSGPRLAALQRALLERAATTLGTSLGNDSGLRLFGDGGPLEVETDGLLPGSQRWRIQLPPGTTAVRLCSRAWTPAWVLPGQTDTRRLGVAIGQIRLDGVDLRTDDPRLADGWHPAEVDWRWTDGAAVLRTRGARTLDFTLAITGKYWIETRSAARAVG